MYTTKEILTIEEELELDEADRQMAMPTNKPKFFDLAASGIIDTILVIFFPIIFFFWLMGWIGDKIREFWRNKYG